MKYFNLLNLKAMSMVALCFTMTLTSCDKKDDDNPEPTPAPSTPTPPSTPSTPSPTFSNGSGTLSAVKTRTFQNIPFVGTTAIDLGVAVAAFYTSPTDSTFLEAGNVTCNTSNLTKQKNNGYVYTPSKTDTEGIKFADVNDEVTWDISGSTDVSAFTETISGNFPEIEKLTSSQTVDHKVDYTLTTSNIQYADSSLFMVGGIYHKVIGNSVSSTFTAAEMAHLKAGTNFVQIASWNIDSRVINGKTYHFVKETVVTQQVTIK